jgi:hypothetical protein
MAWDESVCASKIRYPNRRLANRAVREIGRRRRRRFARPYRCDLCSGYHLTSQRSA